MLSILIPTFNYNVYPLAKKLVSEAENIGFSYELICVDDGSLSKTNHINQQINHLKNSLFIENKNNSGRTATRQFLAQKAQFDWLLFLDADVLPVHDDFLKRLISHDYLTSDVIFGGISYQYKKPDNNHILRWKYGKKREEKSVSDRKKRPYTSIISGAFCVKKKLFLDINQHLLMSKYGLDILFTHKLKCIHATVNHINNPVFHYGLETNQDYLSKSKESLITLNELLIQNAIPKSSTPLLRLYFKLLSFKLIVPIAYLTYKFNNVLEKNLLGNSPSLLVFDLYRLGYFSRLNKNQ